MLVHMRQLCQYIDELPCSANDICSVGIFVEPGINLIRGVKRHIESQSQETGTREVGTNDAQERRCCLQKIDESDDGKYGVN